MPDFRQMPPNTAKPEIPHGTFVRFSCSALQNGAPERPVRIWGRVSDEPHVGPPLAHEPLVGQVWAAAAGRRLWVVLNDGTARLVSARDCTVLGMADECVEDVLA